MSLNDEVSAIRALLQNPDGGHEAHTRAKALFTPAVGHLVMSFGELERSIDDKLNQLTQLELNEGGPIWTQVSSVIAKVSLIHHIVISRDTTRLDDAKNFKTTTGNINKFRNAIIHGPWRAFYTHGNDIVWQKSWFNRQNHKPEFLNIKLSELVQKSEDCRSMQLLLSKITHGL